MLTVDVILDPQPHECEIACEQHKRYQPCRDGWRPRLTNRQSENDQATLPAAAGQTTLRSRFAKRAFVQSHKAPTGLLPGTAMSLRDH
jgi:hypothetical protein